MKLSIIMPVYNERNTIREIVKRVKEVNLEKEIIIIDDGSTDGTTDILRELDTEGDTPIKIIHHKENQGKGASIRSGLKYAAGEIIVIQDGDLEYAPQDYYKLIEPIINDETGVVYGSRILGKGEKLYRRFYWGGRLLSWITNILYNARITDESTCYKAFRIDILKKINLKCKRFEFCPEVTAKVCKMGYKIKEVPISYHPRKIEEGKKIKWTDGLTAIFTLLKYRFFK